MRFIRRASALAAVATLFGVGGQLQAQEVQFRGYTQGCFAEGSATCGEAGIAQHETFLTFTGGFFDQTTVGGEASLNMGTFALLPLFGDFNFDTFRLLASFFSPGATQVFQAALSGSVAFGQGTVSLDFSPQTVVYEGGSFFIDIQDVVLTAPNNGSATLIGKVSVPNAVVATPEPATVGLMAIGLVALVPLYRLRRRSAQQSA